MEKQKGYTQKTHAVPTKRYCQTLDLKDDPALIQEYVKRHSEMHHWPEIAEGIRTVGILEMEIYQQGTRLFMIVETPLDFEWDSAFEKLATLPRQAEWEEYMSIFQQADAGATSSEKWKLMDRIFRLYD
ncbi:L-rhamnose mutarotase [Parabacteroides sp. PF5-5]|uniref:L-rhamnose mutarotase n=1 Tax=unclassified Parabacteroides TaxID=2649774 RepID=UPI002473E7D7|nr:MULTISPECIES: L-rhamnose mutarotase [unclassified Parabacteroides]MDH6304851.1 L-rhamnose mutarotase [Parabacteroides sp. PH5-39]MDH6316063.1 L-rhamnose mutarotase [Parabacteroides sp. PF5-13]MDH6319720.1 L-rhamnose mutarotase [Parabacteroides sp. PH5-13]MDH6323451.1 L-rhamnose mutarotase [Parabacteroides sp. PH5-8]MDH6327041.1 L-rhamnose mutarotase [Parabacteroides sp. PH5-41]